MNLQEAQDVTERIKQTTEDLWELMYQAHEGKAWEVLGYSSWKSYVESEFQMSKQHSFRLLDQAKVIEAFAVFAGHPRVTEREARRIKPVLNQALTEVRESIAAGEEPAVAVTNAVQKYGAPPPSQARLIAQETHIPVIGSDNRVHDSRPLEVIERESAAIDRRQGLLSALAHISDNMSYPREEARNWPDYLEEQLHGVLLMNGPLAQAMRWLCDFMDEWQHIFEERVDNADRRNN